MTKICSAALFLCMAGPTLADPPTEVMNIMREPDLKFMPSKVVQGASQAVIWGNPAKPGETYVVRNRFSPGAFSPPHFHPEMRYITVLKGTWWGRLGPEVRQGRDHPRAGRQRGGAPCEPDPLGRREGRRGDRADHGHRPERDDPRG